MTSPDHEKTLIQAAFALARAEKPAYAHLYPLLEPLFLIQTEARSKVALDPFAIDPERVRTKWESGFPLLQRWDFPIDVASAETVLSQLQASIPHENSQLTGAVAALLQAIAAHPDRKAALWKSFLQHEWEPWEEWVETAEVDVASLLFLARSCLRPSIEWTAEELSQRFPVPTEWRKGYCPVCGSLPALLFLVGEGERKGYCSWCGTTWGLHRLQCPTCDNRYHESLGYLALEAEPHYRVHTCNLCKTYFKAIDTRERMDPPYLPLEEWTTLHLDLLAQRAGWVQPPSPSPVVYGSDRS